MYRSVKEQAQSAEARSLPNTVHGIQRRGERRATINEDLCGVSTMRRRDEE